MDFVHLSSATEQQRLSYGRMVTDLRRARHWSQKQLADLSGVDRKTISNMETGTHAAQVEKLRLVFQALGVPTETERYSDETESWLAVVGKLIDSIDSDRRPEAVTRAVAVFASYLPPHADVGGGGEDSRAPIVSLSDRQRTAGLLPADALDTTQLKAATIDPELDQPEPDPGR